MKKQGIASKRAEGVRQSKRSQLAAELDREHGLAVAFPIARFARQSDQSPPASLDQPWVNLHPERIWPD
jgi:hypothetical protein